MEIKTIIKKVLAGTFLTAFVIISGIVTIIFHPQALFAHTMEYRNVTVYSNDQIDPNITRLLDNAIKLLEKSELHDPDYTFDLFLSYNSFYNKIDDKVLGYGPSARATDNNVVIKVEVDISRNLFFPTFYQKCQGDLTYLIAHEMVHCLQAHRYGKLRFNPFRHPAIWKLEGYPEYIARQDQLQSEGYALRIEIERYIELERNATDIWLPIEDTGCKAPAYYYKSRLMTEYLMDVKNYSYDEILNDSISAEEIFIEMIEWKEETVKEHVSG